MKRFLIFSLLLALAATAFPQVGSEWKEIQPDEITVNPIHLFKDGLALTVQDGDHANSMMLTMGTLGYFRGKGVLAMYVNESRYTYDLLMKNPYFTVEAFPEAYKEHLNYLGHHSGRDGSDKIKAAGLTAAKTAEGTPYILEGNLLIECRLVYTGSWDEDKLDDFIKAPYYRDGTRRPMHQQLLAEILHVWVKE